MFSDIFNVLIKKYFKKTKKIILIYFQVKNTLKNNYHHNLKYPIKKKKRWIKCNATLHHQERVIICLISDTFDFPFLVIASEK